MNMENCPELKRFIESRHTVNDVREDFATNKRKRPPREQYIPVMAVKNKKPHVKRTISLIHFPVNADNDLRAEAASVLWRAVNQEQDKDASFEHYLSYLSVMLPELRNDIEICVRDSGYILAYNEFPNSMAYNDYNNIDTMPLYLAPSMVYLGVSLLLPYKNITSENYRGYFTKRIAALSNMVGGDSSKMGLPFSVEKCIYFKAKMNEFDIIRKKIIRFLISEDVKAETLFNVVARYVTQMVEWDEMTEFKFVNEALVASGSPVLRCKELASEVSKFFDIAERVFACSHPSLFRYLGAEGELIAVDQSQFPILYAVAYIFMSELYVSVRQLCAPSNVNSKIVQRYVAQHRTYLDKASAVALDCCLSLHATRTRNLSERLIRLKSLAEKGGASLAMSVFLDSHTVDD